MSEEPIHLLIAEKIAIIGGKRFMDLSILCSLKSVSGKSVTKTYDNVTCKNCQSLILKNSLHSLGHEFNYRAYQKLYSPRKAIDLVY